MHKIQLRVIFVSRMIVTALIILSYLTFSIYYLLFWFKKMFLHVDLGELDKTEILLQILLFVVVLALWLVLYFFIWSCIVVSQAMIIKHFLAHAEMVVVFPEASRKSKIFLFGGIVDKFIHRLVVNKDGNNK